MCIICNPSLADAFRGLSYKSRRQFLRSAAGAVAGTFVAEAVNPAFADGAINQMIGKGFVAGPATIFVAKKIITMECDNPTATAVAVAGNKIPATGSLDQVKLALGDRPYRLDQTFANKVLTPGFIDQHLHPVLGALTLSVEVIAPEDWPMPSKTFKAAATPEEYRKSPLSTRPYPWRKLEIRRSKRSPKLSPLNFSALSPQFNGAACMGNVR